jgi:hypothetical protein
MAPRAAQPELTNVFPNFLKGLAPNQDLIFLVAWQRFRRRKLRPPSRRVQATLLGPGRLATASAPELGLRRCSLRLQSPSILIPGRLDSGSVCRGRPRCDTVTVGGLATGGAPTVSVPLTCGTAYHVGRVSNNRHLHSGQLFGVAEALTFDKSWRFHGCIKSAEERVRPTSISGTDVFGAANGDISRGVDLLTVSSPLGLS